MTPLMIAAIALYSVNAVLFGYLTFIYGRTVISTRARYPLGLFIFSLLLLLHSAGTAAAYFLFNPYFQDEVVPYMSMMGSFEFVGVLALLRITL